MQITITTKKPVFDDVHGRLKEGDVIDVAAQKANFYIGQGLAMSYQTKVMQDRPSLGAGVTEPLSALPVAPVLPQTTVSESEPGAKKKGRKPKQSS